MKNLLVGIIAAVVIVIVVRSVRGEYNGQFSCLDPDNITYCVGSKEGEHSEHPQRCSKYKSSECAPVILLPDDEFIKLKSGYHKLLNGKGTSIDEIKSVGHTLVQCNFYPDGTYRSDFTFSSTVFMISSENPLDASIPDIHCSIGRYTPLE